MYVYIYISYIYMYNVYTQYVYMSIFTVIRDGK